MSTVKKLRKNPREVVKTIAPNHKVFAKIEDFPFPLENRLFISENAWMKNPDGSFVFAFQPPKSDNFVDNTLVNLGKNTSRQLINAKSWGFGIIKPTGTHNNDSCHVTWVLKIDLKGNIPPTIMEAQIPHSLKLISHIHEKFSRDDEIDRIEREKLMAIMRNAGNRKGGEVYDESETHLIEEVQQRMEKASDDIFRPLNR